MWWRQLFDVFTTRSSIDVPPPPSDDAEPQAARNHPRQEAPAHRRKCSSGRPRAARTSGSSWREVNSCGTHEGLTWQCTPTRSRCKVTSLEKITRAKPVQALGEFIWNSLDADASAVDVFFEANELGVLSRIIVRDNGTGMERARAPELFGSLGGSWKRPGATTRGGRFLHGQDGRGRFKVFSLGNVAEWEVTCLKDGARATFSVAMAAARLKEVSISDETDAGADKPRGVTLTISEIHKDFPLPDVRRRPSGAHRNLRPLPGGISGRPGQCCGFPD
jgi:hypothetical protein